VSSLLASSLLGEGVLSTIGTHLADDFEVSPHRLPDLDHRVLRILSISILLPLALLTEIVVVADGTLIADASDGVHAADITLDVLVHLLVLLKSLVDDVVAEDSLHVLLAEDGDVLLDDLRHLGELLVHQDAAAFAFAAGQAFLVHLASIAFEAGDLLLETLLLALIFIRDEEVASNLGVVSCDIHLNALVGGVGPDAITAHIFHDSLSLDGLSLGVD